MQYVPITPAVYQTAWDTAARRQATKDQYRVKDKRITPRKSSTQIHFEGLLAEMAVAQVLGRTANLSTSVAGDGGYGDLELPDGRTISVKYSGLHGGDLALRSDRIDELKDDLAVLCWALDPKDLAQGMIIAGWTDRESFARDAVIHDYGYGKRLIVPFEDLKPVAQLVETVREQTGGD